jgi:hypothetical protein
MPALPAAPVATSLPPPSAEQLAVVRSIADDGVNVKLESVAGSGKTTLSLHCIMRLRDLRPGSRVLVLTYNSNLKTETRCKVDALGLSAHAEVHSFHSFGTRYWDAGCRTDEALDEMVVALRAGAKLKRDAVFDLVIVDESQDITPLYWDLIVGVSRLCRCEKPPLQFLFIGDPRQSIYEYKGASRLFLSECDTRMPRDISGDRPWRSHSLSTTWRLSEPMTHFVNDVLLGGERILASPDIPPDSDLISQPVMMICNMFDISATAAVFDMLKRWRPDQIMVLAPSVKKGRRRSPLRVLEKRLLDRNVPLSVNDVFEECSLSDEVLRGKLAFMTFHGCKGAEREAVLVMGGTDEAYPLFFQRDKDASLAEICPNPVYVSMTRAKRELVVLHNVNSGFAPYVDMAALARTADVRGALAPPKRLVDDDSAPIVLEEDTRVEVGVTALLEHLQFDKVKRACSYLSYTTSRLTEVADPPELRSSVKTARDRAEYVADLNGIAIPAILEYETTGSSWLLNSLPSLNLDSSATCLSLRDQLLERAAEGLSDVADFLCAATLHQSSKSQYFYRAKQISSFRWLDRKAVDAALAVFRAAGIGGANDAVRFEVPLRREFSSERVLFGDADVVVTSGDAAHTALYELKCTGGDVQLAHILQTAMYAWMIGDVSIARLVYMQSATVCDIDWDEDAIRAAIDCILA